MASIRTRGPKNARRYYVACDVGGATEGKRVQRMHLMKGVNNLVDARQELARVERELAAGRDPFAVIVKEAIGALLNRWKEGLSNRSAEDDRSRITNYLEPRFKYGGLQLDRCPEIPTARPRAFRIGCGRLPGRK